MKNKIFLFLLLPVLVLVFSCERDIDPVAPSANGINFSKFVSVGNSLTAGYSGGALYKSGQEVSVPNLIAMQLQKVGGGAFNQPYIGTEAGVGIQQTPAGMYLPTKMTLQVLPDKDCSGNPTGTFSLNPALMNPAVNQQEQMGYLTTPPTNPGPYNNLGVPGAMLMHLFFKGYGSQAGNPFYARFATSPNTSIIEEAMSQNPTFFYLWIGNNDILLSALAGTDAMITPVDTFAKYFPMAAGALGSVNGNKGVVATLPSVTDIPFFTTISQSLPYNAVPLTAEQASGLNMLYTLYGHPEITWHEGMNPFVIQKENGTWAQMGPEDLFLLTLPTDSVRCRGMGTADTTVHPLPKPYPIPGRFVLDAQEQAHIKSAAAAYNQVIKATAQSLGLALADMEQEMIKLSSEAGITYNGVKMTTEFIKGGVISTDGIHLTPRGNAQVANIFIDAINAKYGCTIPKIDITKYSGVVFP